MSSSKSIRIKRQPRSKRVGIADHDTIWRRAKKIKQKLGLIDYDGRTRLTVAKTH
ncbi:hypothetical protein GGTG_13345 [Gaeumannomyces tritici R3-111a-1]|uniref:Uncharacterized protein n=1 Tax=Gaeumannomyces tritici (strain R3-111a-1) TaxID=644352 RepID=J3PIL6_GAET3|nr:hypothetical protein GGTG_13345 [Gaeumannomyces tritici R3-111a-1]EJT69077.1 hypothetical protein GGTG_13345 [Gaeumannomyces tritici R3-111a-1]